MMQTKDILAQLYSILNCKMALVCDNQLYCYPEVKAFSADDLELGDYHTWAVDAHVGKRIFYTEKKVDISESTMALAILYLKNHLDSKTTAQDPVINILSDHYNYSDIAAINQLIDKERELYFIALSGIDISGLKSELLEIIKNTLDVKHVTEYQDNLVALVEAQEIHEACSDLQRNILTELYVEATIAIGGSLESAQQINALYDNCAEAILLKQNYGLNQKLLDYQSMLIYRLVASIDKVQKDSIVESIFSNRFVELLNNEMEQTIEEMFKNNLNLTDAAARLYIHRNTLLYRIEKIYKLTGFDLRKFEDSMIFKLAWLMYKEKLKQKCTLHIRKKQSHGAMYCFFVFSFYQPQKFNNLRIDSML